MRKPRFALIALPTAMLIGLTAILIIAARGPGKRPQPRPIPLAASLQSADLPIAQALRERLARKLDDVDGRAARNIRDFYRARGFAPIWIADGVPSHRFAAARDYLGALAAEGLDPSHYPVPDFLGDPTALAAAEIRFTAAILTYARHAQHGRVPYSRISPDIHYETQTVKAPHILDAVARAENVVDVLDALHPTHESYRALRAKLAELRAGDSDRQRLVDARRGPPILEPAEIVIANMERWRWMPRELGQSHVMVNIPDYTLRLMQDGSTTFQSKIIVGTPSWPTPIMSAAITSITVNPTWNVPRSIVESEYLPALKLDAGGPERLGLKVVERGDGSIHMYQLPGDFNPLGRLRVNFPNKFSVYQHDTPDKFLFEAPVRAYSHGCMRVQDALGYAQALLALARPDGGYTRARLRALYGDSEIDVELAAPIPVHLTYQTAFVDDGGRLVIRDDIYGHDAHLLAALASAERKMAATGSTTH